MILDNRVLTQGDRCELFGALIDVVEDWLEEKGITKDHIPNDEREDEDSAIIYGSDYDELADAFSKILGIDRDAIVPLTSKTHIINIDDYIAWKLWQKEDVLEQLKTDGYAPIPENLSYVLQSSYISQLGDCTDTDWEIISLAIKEVSDSLIPLEQEDEIERD